MPHSFVPCLWHRNTGAAQHQLSMAEQEARRLQASMVELQQAQQQQLGPERTLGGPASPSRGCVAGGYAAWHPGGLHLEASIEKRVLVGSDLVSFHLGVEQMML